MKRLQYVQSFDGYNYLRYKKQPRVRLPDGKPTGPAFMADYWLALAAAKAADEPRPPAPPNPRRGKKKQVTNGTRHDPAWDTARDAVTDYLGRQSFSELAPKTQSDRRYILANWVDGGQVRRSSKRTPGYGNELLREVTYEALETMLDHWIEDRGRGAARNWLAAVRGVLDDRKRAGAINRNPILGLKMPPLRSKKKAEGITAWEPEHLAMYRDYWPSGTPQRLAVEVLYCTGAACCDAIRLTLAHVKRGLFEFAREKTGVEAFAALSPELEAEIAACGLDGSVGVLLRNLRGKPFRNPQYFSISFAGWARQAGLPEHYSAHGVRKLAATDDAFAGWTHTELKAKYGWKTSQQVDPYIEKAARRRALEQRRETRTRTVA